MCHTATSDYIGYNQKLTLQQQADECLLPLLFVLFFSYAIFSNTIIIFFQRDILFNTLFTLYKLLDALI